MIEDSLIPGQRVVATIQDLAFGGDGVARLDDFVIFVPFVALGEEVEVEIIERKKNFGRARLVRVLKPSPDRVTPPCRYFGNCGGCQYQHLNYPAQLRLKHQQVADLFQRVSHEPLWEIGMPHRHEKNQPGRFQLAHGRQRLAVGRSL